MTFDQALRFRARAGPEELQQLLGQRVRIGHPGLDGEPAHPITESALVPEHDPAAERARRFPGNGGARREQGEQTRFDIISGAGDFAFVASPPTHLASVQIGREEQVAGHRAARFRGGTASPCRIAFPA
ncbi:hypothetical protein [Amycolatopsis sp. 195334CR]|uniref:hypothetical protein n=1 Tax=Amycolatopsis sp. 195334CR TaxID=2814588 RepID=UPI001A8C6466|nr:hypothetical protein [Amycolatopsis sp. 195334CR]MBN6038340.1 hypothetical protein [Amycolatopsis sp. 195334CR]